MKSILLLLTLALVTFGSCKKWQHKYPEDTERTKLTPLERLTGKHWKLLKTTFNGMDYTDSVINNIGTYEVYFSLQEDHETKTGYITTDIEGGFGIVWGLYKNESYLGLSRMEFIITDYPFVPSYDKIQNNTYRSYNILKLSADALKIQFINSARDTIISNEFTL